MANDIDTYEGFIAEAKKAMEETFEQHLLSEIDDVAGISKK